MLFGSSVALGLFLCLVGFVLISFLSSLRAVVSDVSLLFAYFAGCFACPFTSFVHLVTVEAFHDAVGESVSVVAARAPVILVVMVILVALFCVSKLFHVVSPVL